MKNMVSQFSRVLLLVLGSVGTVDAVKNSGNPVVPAKSVVRQIIDTALYVPKVVTNAVVGGISSVGSGVKRVMVSSTSAVGNQLGKLVPNRLKVFLNDHDLATKRIVTATLVAGGAWGVYKWYHSSLPLAKRTRELVNSFCGI